MDAYLQILFRDGILVWENCPPFVSLRQEGDDVYVEVSEDQSVVGVVRYQTGGCIRWHVDVQKSARFSLISIQQKQCSLDDTMVVQLQENAHASLHWMVAELSTFTTKRQVDVFFHGPHSNFQLYGLHVMSEQASVETKTHLRHLAPYTTATQQVKSVLFDRATSLFSGLVHVEPVAQKTDSNQYNHSLILSDQARAISKPQLEIFADDVKCSHGATIGQLDRDEWFYLLTRGLSDCDAKSMLLTAYCQEIIDTIPIEDARDRMMHTLLRKLATV